MKKTTKYQWIIGLTTKEGNQISPTEAMKAVSSLMLKLANINCFTIAKHTGFWNGAAEESLAVTYLSIDPEINDEIAAMIGSEFTKAFMQQCVLVTKEEIDYLFA